MAACRDRGWICSRPNTGEPSASGSGIGSGEAFSSSQKTLNLNVCQVNNLVFLVKFKETTKISIQIRVLWAAPFICKETLEVYGWFSSCIDVYCCRHLKIFKSFLRLRLTYFKVGC